MKVFDNIREINLVAEHATGEIDKEVQLPVEQFIVYWKLIRAALRLAKIFTGEKADAKIDEIITWGDNLSGESKPRDY